MQGRDDKARALLLRIRGIGAEPRVRDACFYAVKAVILAVFLTVAGTCAAAWPAAAFPFVLLIYALVATMGALYYVVVRRIHRQDMFAAGGTLSRYNRRWTAWLIVLFIFSLCSAFAFVLGAPRWDGLEWGLIWFSIPLYFVVFEIADHYAKREYRAQYHRAKAMKWSCAIVLIFLCTAYALLSVHDSMGDQAAALDALRNPYMPFSESPSALLAESDKISALVNNLTDYGLGKIAASSFVAAFAVRFALSFSVFLGVVSQLGFCMLTLQEMKGELRLLPAREEDEGASHPVQRSYLAAIVVVWAVASGVFLVADSYAAEMRKTSEYTAVDAFVSKHTEEVVFLLEGGLEDHLENQAVKDKYGMELDEAIAARKETLDPAIDAYYDRCIDHVDSYIDWRAGIVGGLAGSIGSFGEGIFVSTFEKKVAAPSDPSQLEREYALYVEELVRLNSSYWIEINDGGSDAPLAVRAIQTELEHSKEPALWRLLDEGSVSGETLAVLKNSGNVDREAYKAELVGLIEQARSDTFADVERIESICRSSMSVAL